MRLVPFSTRWWRGWCAVAVLLGMLAPQPALALTPDWLAAAICSAPGADRPAHPAHGTAPHIHCALCLLGQALAMPPVANGPARRLLGQVQYAHPPMMGWPGPGPDRAYASRAPPPIT
jgi:hypothetical protein